MAARFPSEVRAAAAAMRLGGATYREIAAAVGVSPATLSGWLRGLPAPPRASEHARRMARARWDRELARRQDERERRKAAAAAELVPVTGRDLFVAGVVAYWAEGSKDKPYARRERVTFANSDPAMVLLFGHWLDLVGVDWGSVRCALMIHETADARSAEEYWRSVLAPRPAVFWRTQVKRHNPRTNRRQVGEGYHGCLALSVLGSAQLYQRIEGWWAGLCAALPAPDRERAP